MTFSLCCFCTNLWKRNRNYLNVSVNFQDDAITARLLQDAHLILTDTNSLGSNWVMQLVTFHFMTRHFRCGTGSKRDQVIIFRDNGVLNKRAPTDHAGFAECDVSLLNLERLMTLIQKDNVFFFFFLKAARTVYAEALLHLQISLTTKFAAEMHAD